MSHYKFCIVILTTLSLLLSCSKEKIEVQGVITPVIINPDQKCVPLPTYSFTLADEMNGPLLDSQLC